jgi:hypothetical protein
MPHDFILQRITISISTLSKYVREKNHKKIIHHFVPSGFSTRYKCPPATSEGEGTFVSCRGSTRYKCEVFVPGISPGTNAPPHLYRMLCTGSIRSTNEGYEPVQMHVFPVVYAP